MLRRLLAVLHARNMEFLRDRSSLGWNLLLPVLLVAGMAIIFAGSERALFKVAVLGAEAPGSSRTHPFLQTRYVDFFPVAERERALRKVARHQIDMLLDLSEPAGYWVNTESPKGYLLERLLLAAGGEHIERRTIAGARIRYIDWLLPGILGMNMMFSCLFGVGFVVVRYRKSGFLRRLNATPLRPIEFITAQVLSRMLLVMTIGGLLFVGAGWLIGFRMLGSYLTLALIGLLGTVAMIALGLVVAARVSSEELASGLLNLLSWPMMVLSGVWFSLEGSPAWVQQIARFLPLTQMLEAARAVSLEGAGLREVAGNLLALAAMGLVFLALGAALFRWRPD